jgi:hypothetical protein
MTQSELDPELIMAYKATHFDVRMAKPFTLEIGKHSPILANWHRIFRVSSSAFITAQNPFGKKLTSSENENRINQLKSEMKESYLTVVNGYGYDPIRVWGKEDSCLVYGITLEEAKAVGKKYEQNAIVWCDSDAIPQLILLR